MAITLLCSPITPALLVRDRGFTVGTKQTDPRITFTVPLINHSQMVGLFSGGGPISKEALSHIFAQDGDDLAYSRPLNSPPKENYGGY